MTEKHGRKSWRKSWRLFNQAIYIYLISCRVELSFWFELSSQASQLDLSAQIQLLNLTQHFFKKISTQFNTFQVEYLTWTQVLDLTSSIYTIDVDDLSQCSFLYWSQLDVQIFSIILHSLWHISYDDFVTKQRARHREVYLLFHHHWWISSRLNDCLHDLLFNH